MIEYQILKQFCLDKQNYQRYNKVLNIVYIKNNYSILYKIYNIITIIYNKYNNNNITKQELESKYLSSYPVLKDSERTELHGLIERIFASEGNADLLSDYLETHRQRALAGELALKALEVAEGRGEFSSLNALWDSYKSRSDAVEVEYVSDDLDTLYERTAASEGLSWPWECLNHSLGPLRKGNFGFVFARPEVGKTTFLSQFITYLAQHTDRPLLWFNNEQPGEEVKLRMYQALFGLSVQDLFKDRAKYKKLYADVTKGLIKLKDDATISREEVEMICEQEQPGLVIFDQIDKITGFSDDRYDLELGKRYQWARELAKAYCPVIGVTQADASGENVKYLTMGNVANAKTAKQAEADWILGIGATQHDDFALYRYFNISKNKLLGDENTNAAERHGKYQLIIEPEIARYREIGAS